MKTTTDGATGVNEIQQVTFDAATGGKMANVVDVLDALTKAAGDGDLKAIKDITDQIRFGVANQVNANAKSLNDAALTGDGKTATPWRAA